ncbi:MAG: DUF2214 domain-containing protein [Beijerinckiaceae bacterium]|nr:DUF2214 domain-containing protein [Beijerinckiaceae bacterium]
MEGLIQTLESLGPVAALRTSTIAYPAVNALHIIGLGLLLGAVVALDLRILGWRRRPNWRDEAMDLGRLAALGLALALVTGLALLSVRIGRYLENPALWLKFALIALGLANALWLGRHLRLSGSEPSVAIRLGAAVSLAVWPAAIFAGRWIAFVE